MILTPLLNYQHLTPAPKNLYLFFIYLAASFTTIFIGFLALTIIASPHLDISIFRTKLFLTQLIASILILFIISLFSTSVYISTFLLLRKFSTRAHCPKPYRIAFALSASLHAAGMFFLLLALLSQTPIIALFVLFFLILPTPTLAARLTTTSQATLPENP